MTDKIRLGISLAFLVVGFFVVLAFAGLTAAIIFALLWFEKVTLGLSQGMLAEVGIEFATVPMILIGVLYGPFTAFLVGFLGLPALEAVRWIISPPKYSGGWPPLVPGPDSFVDGATGATAGFLIQLFSFGTAAPLSVIAKNILKPVSDMMTYGKPPSPTIFINLVFNILLVNVLSFVVVQ